MARTIQSSRLSLAQIIPRKQIIQIKTKINQGRSKSSIPTKNIESKKQTNIQSFSVKLNSQKVNETKAVPFAVVECLNCGAYLNSESIIIEKRERRRREVYELAEVKKLHKLQWKCEFCMFNNSLPSYFENLPEQNQCYLLQNPQVNNDSQQSKKENLLLFCIDVSGSMDKEFQGVSRIDAVKQGVLEEIKRIKYYKEKTMVGIITFGQIVTIFTGNQTINIPAITDDDFNKIIQQSQNLANYSFAQVNVNNFKNFKDYIADISTYGQSVLGSSLLMSIKLASTGRKGSKIILCTDEQASIGINDSEFYTKTTEYAKRKEVVVNILNIKGDNCNLKELRKLTLSTGGSILKIDPKLIGSEVKKISIEEISKEEISIEEILGCESVLNIIVNKMFEIQEGIGQLSKDHTVMSQDFGRFSADTELTFNFKILSKEEAASKGVFYDLFANKKVPIQIQLIYTTPSGAKYLQVITDYRILSENTEDLLEEIDFSLFAANKLQKLSSLIREERFEQAEQQVKTYEKMVANVFSKREAKKQLEKFNLRVQKLAKILESKKKKTGLKAKGKPKQGKTKVI